MGMKSEILCIGPFNRDIIHILDYPKEYYRNTKKGTLVTASVCHCNTTEQSLKLARALDIEDPWDFNRHAFSITTPRNIDWMGLGELSAECDEWDYNDCKTLITLMQHNFTCIFQPNG